MFPPIEPFAFGHLQTSDGNEIYWEASGNPKGKPALFLHGGPGSGNMGGYRRRFDPEAFFVVSLDQRGCGRSRPLAVSFGDTLGDVRDGLATNTTATLLADIEALRTHLGIESWLVTGVSWGTTLALAYARTHPACVRGLVMTAVTTTSEREVAWITESMGELFPREWKAFEEQSGRRPGQRLVDAYYERITDPDPAVRERAAIAWCAWEDTHVSLDPNFVRDPRFDDPTFRDVFATLVIHYWKHAGFDGGRALLDDVALVRHLPVTLIHGRLDVSSPLSTAWRLHEAWPGSELVIVPDEGHGGPKMMAETVRAIAAYAV
ncbi:Proline iminopeptidase [Labilithrix luteola]|uniref:Proline iminopeptidase n=1 Tax=Labilithrix luteola TaxID=1391654 RepID=A0A0K1PQ80_9BACT|nr:prolyl aminopeptidase [Labilithrix luteola]AKU95259.1 Proline iminopeptidase [Labilithrix luteola]